MGNLGFKMVLSGIGEDRFWAVSRFPPAKRKKTHREQRRQIETKTQRKRKRRPKDRRESERKVGALRQTTEKEKSRNIKKNKIEITGKTQKMD